MWYRNSGGIVVSPSAQQDEAPSPLIHPVSYQEPIAHRSWDIGMSAGQEENKSTARQPTEQDTSSMHTHAVGSLHNNVDFTNPANVTSLFWDPSFHAPDPLLDVDWLFEHIPSNFNPMERGTGEEFSPTQTGSSEDDRSALKAGSPSSAPWFSAQARLFEALGTLPKSVLSSAFFMPSNLSHFFDLYFENYHPHFPILHRPTLNPATAPALLIAAIVTLGATLSKDDDHFQISTQIHDSLRYIIFTLMKRGVSYVSPVGNMSHLDFSWKQWIEIQSSNRTAFFGFLMDAQHSFMFGHTCVLSVQDVRLPLPCPENVWECNDAVKWDRLIQKAPEPPGFLPVLKDLIAQNPIPPQSTPYGRLILLHGLFSVAAHLKARESATLGVGGTAPDRSRTSTIESWKDTLEKALDTWSFCLVSRSSSLALEASKPLYRMAYVAIYTDVTDMHILAGAPSLLGNLPSEPDLVGATARVEAWREKPESKRVLYHCLLLIQEILFTGKQYLACQDNISLRPWSLYHAVLILWAYGFMSGRRTKTQARAIPLNAEEYLVRMLMLIRNEEDVSVVSQQTGELLLAVRDCFVGCRWELLQEAYVTLGRLVDIAA
ncbi:Krueppel c2h2-type zinc finger protein [Penicillium chermesinum]|nr:Krueppel c2h2-type zinc finger protein [Penicillium chermesinum]